MSTNLAQSKLSSVVVSALVVFSLACCLPPTHATSGDNSTSTSPDLKQDITDLLDKGVIYVYTMTNFFLNDIIQSKYLTTMKGTVDLSTPSAFLTSWTADWNAWIVYLIGFTVCVALGVVLCVVMILACLIFPCCRCRGRCGASSKNSARVGASKCKTIACSVALLVVAVGLAFGSVGMYLTNEVLRDQLDGELFTSLDFALQGTTKYFDDSAQEYNATILGQFLKTEGVVIQKLENIPEGAIAAIDNATGAVTALNKLTEFSNQLEKLQQNLLDMETLAGELVTETTSLEGSISGIVSDVLAALGGCSTAECSQTAAIVSETRVRVNFSVVDVSTAISAVNLSLSLDLPQLVYNSMQEIRNIEASINATASPHVESTKSAVKDMESELSSIVDDINSTLSTFDTASIQSTLDDVQDLSAYQLGIDVTYWVFVALASLVALVVVLDLLGVVLGWILRAHADADRSCGCSKIIGYHVLITATAFTFVFYWLMTLLVALMFAAGGLAHTEFCRNVVHHDQAASAEVLAIFDDWIEVQMMQSNPDMSVRLFEAYSKCEENASLFKAFDLASKFNLTQKTEESAVTIKDATDDFKAAEFLLPAVNLSDPTLIHVLRTLDSAFMESSLNFTNIYENTEGDITDPDLLVLAGFLEAVKDVDLSAQATNLRSLHTSTVVPMSARQHQFLTATKSADDVIHLVSFGQAADTLQAADDVINENGTYIVSGFVNSTVDEVNDDLQGYVTSVADDVEHETARCEPLYLSLRRAVDGFCVQMLYPLNGFWFSLGWCIFFLVPNIFLSVNLAAYFKAGKSSNCVRHKDSS